MTLIQSIPRRTPCLAACAALPLLAPTFQQTPDSEATLRRTGTDMPFAQLSIGWVWPRGTSTPARSSCTDQPPASEECPDSRTVHRDIQEHRASQSLQFPTRRYLHWSRSRRQRCLHRLGLEHTCKWCHVVHKMLRV